MQILLQNGNAFGAAFKNIIILNLSFMYKVFINNHPLIITKTDSDFDLVEDDLFLQYDASSLNELLNLAHTHDNFFRRIYLVHKEPKKVFENLKEQCRWIEAAGGLVKNNKNELLMIFRSGKWDLPKGKLEKNETPEIAGIREVEEECGISKLKIIKALEPTFHTYIHKEKMVLKKTFWYEMTCGDDKKLIPQKEEGITEVKWMKKEEVEEAKKNTYYSILDVLNQK